MYARAMRRTQIYLDEDLAEELKGVAAAEERTASAVIRDAVRRYLADQRGEPADPILAAAGSVAGLPPDAAEAHDRDLYRAVAG